MLNPISLTALAATTIQLADSAISGMASAIHGGETFAQTLADDSAATLDGLQNHLQSLLADFAGDGGEAVIEIDADGEFKIQHPRGEDIQHRIEADPAAMRLIGSLAGKTDSTQRVTLTLDKTDANMGSKQVSEHVSQLGRFGG